MVLPTTIASLLLKNDQKKPSAAVSAKQRATKAPTVNFMVNISILPKDFCCKAPNDNVRLRNVSLPCRKVPNTVRLDLRMDEVLNKSMTLDNVASE